MTITVNLPPATIEELKAEAAATGKDVEKLVRKRCKRSLLGASKLLPMS